MSRRRALGTFAWVAASAVIGGIGSYVMLIVVARAVTPAEYGAFATFWSLIALLGLGVYLPIEQETSRRIAPIAVEPGKPQLLRTVFAVSGTLTLIVLIVIAMLSPAWVASGFLNWTLIAAIGITIVLFTFSFPIRGIVSGLHHPARYAATIAADGLLRIAVPFVLLAVGSGVGVYAFAVPVILVLAMLPTLPDLLSVRRMRLPAATYGSFAGSALRIVLATFAIQALLNAPVLLSPVAAPDDPALAGRVLAVITLARIPIIIYQSVQVLYLPRVARAHEHGGHAGRIIAVAAAAALAVGVVSVLALAFLGEWVIGLIFGEGIVLGGAVEIVLALGAAIFLVAQVLSDACVATGKHTTLVAVWIPALVAGALAFLIPLEPALRVSLPLLVGSTVAAVAFAIVLTLTLRRRPLPVA